MIKVSRVTPYIPINISQIKFIELTIYSYSLIPLFHFIFLSSISINFSCELAAALKSRPALNLSRAGGMRRKSARRHREISTAFLYVDFFFFFLFFFTFARKAEKTVMAISAVSIFLQRSKRHWVIFPSFVILSSCYLITIN